MALLLGMDPGSYEKGLGWLATSGKGTRTRSGARHTDDVKPGALKVQLPHARGKEKSTHMYTGGTIFGDNMSSVMFVSNQQYHGYNGFFKSQLWEEQCKTMGQQPTEMSGIGTHHQNAVAEHAIKT
eukprot:7107276-Ditylum_brightwellii.AAC.1